MKFKKYIEKFNPNKIKFRRENIKEIAEIIDIYPRKTFDNTFDIPDIIPNELLRHFIRGF